MTSPHEECTAHSGLNSRVNLIIGLLGAVATLLVFQLGQTMSMRADVLAGLAQLEGRVAVLELRVKALEEK